MASLETDDRLSTVVATLANVEKVFDIETTQDEIRELEIAASAPNLWDDQANAQRSHPDCHSCKEICDE